MAGTKVVHNLEDGEGKVVWGKGEGTGDAAFIVVTLHILAAFWNGSPGLNTPQLEPSHN